MKTKKKKKRKKRCCIDQESETAKFKRESNNRKQIVRFISRTNTGRLLGRLRVQSPNKIRAGRIVFSTRGVELIIKRDTGDFIMRIPNPQPPRIHPRKLV